MLHTVFLGIMMALVKVMAHGLMMSRTWGVVVNTLEDFDVSCRHMRNELLLWYGVRRKAQPNEKLSEVREVKAAYFWSSTQYAEADDKTKTTGKKKKKKAKLPFKVAQTLSFSFFFF